MDSPTQSASRDLPDDKRKVSVLRVTDPTAVGDSIEVYDMDVVSLDADEFEYKQVTVPLVECSLIYQRTSTALRTRSNIHDGFESCFVLGPQSRGSFDGMEMYRNRGHPLIVSTVA
jgi:hypothetical protein